MTVAQLIRKLQKMPQDAMVTISNNDYYFNGETQLLPLKLIVTQLRFVQIIREI